MYEVERDLNITLDTRNHEFHDLAVVHDEHYVHGEGTAHVANPAIDAIERIARGLDTPGPHFEIEPYTGQPTAILNLSY